MLEEENKKLKWAKERNDTESKIMKEKLNLLEKTVTKMKKEQSIIVSEEEDANQTVNRDKDQGKERNVIVEKLKEEVENLKQ